MFRTFNKVCLRGRNVFGSSWIRWLSSDSKTLSAQNVESWITDDRFVEQSFTSWMENGEDLEKARNYADKMRMNIKNGRAEERDLVEYEMEVCTVDGEFIEKTPLPVFCKLGFSVDESSEKIRDIIHNRLIGMVPGETRKYIISAEERGDIEWSEKLVFKMKKEELGDPEDGKGDWAVGDMVTLYLAPADKHLGETPESFPGVLTDIFEDHVLVDCNSPYSGEDLVFTIKLLRNCGKIDLRQLENMFDEFSINSMDDLFSVTDKLLKEDEEEEHNSKTATTIRQGEHPSGDTR